eukprot:76297-Chlamydomonas_euryale.AAC.14
MFLGHANDDVGQELHDRLLYAACSTCVLRTYHAGCMQDMGAPCCMLDTDALHSWSMHTEVCVQAG